MQPLPDLFQPEEQSTHQPYVDTPVDISTDYGAYDDHDDYESEESSVRAKGVGSKVLFTLMFVVLAGAIGGISYFGIGPMLAPPEQLVANNSTSPDVADVLGMSNSDPILDDSLSDSEKQAFLQQLSNLVEVPVDATATVLRLTALPAASEGTFFSEAKPGDILIILQNYGVAHLLRVDENRVVSTGEISTASE